MSSQYLKVNRVFSPVKKYAWLFILLVAFGGLWYPKLGLLMIPMMAALAVLGFLKGKYWCGNYCPHGSLLDGIIMRLSSNRKTPALFRSKITISLAFLFFMFMLGRRLIAVFGLWGTASFADKLGYVFVINYLAVTIISVLLGSFVNPRTWCAFCPMGTFQKLAYKAGKITRLNGKYDPKVTMSPEGKCTFCSRCAMVCPMQLAPYKNISEKNQYESGDCIRCNTCVKQCPLGLLSISRSPTSRPGKPAA